MPLLKNGEYIDTPFDLVNRKLVVYDQIKIDGIRTFGWQGVKSPIEVIPNHFHKDCFEFHYLIQGNHTFVVDDKEYPIKGGEVFVTFPNEFHRSGKNVIDARNMYWFSISEKDKLLFLDTNHSRLLLHGLFNIRNRVIPVGNDMKPHIQEAFKYCTSEDINNQLHGALEMGIFLRKLIKYDLKANENTVSKEILTGIDFIKNNVNRNIRLDEVASVCHISLSHFKRKFKSETGDTPVFYIQKCKIEKAKELLLQGKSVTETASELDFCSGNYLSVVFKRITQMTPSEFIKQNNKPS